MIGVGGQTCHSELQCVQGCLKLGENQFDPGLKTVLLLFPFFLALLVYNHKSLCFASHFCLVCLVFGVCFVLLMMPDILDSGGAKSTGRG